MATQTAVKTGSEPASEAQQRIQELRELFADAPEVGMKALENVLHDLASQVSMQPPPPIQSAGRIGSRLGKVAELTKIPDYLDIIDSAWEGWPGIRSPQAKDFLARHQVTAEGWYVDYPDLTVAETGRLQRVGQAVDEFLDKIGD